MFKDIHRSPGECRCRSGFSGPGCQVKCACILVYRSILVTMCTCNIVTCIIAVCLMVLPDRHQDCVRLLGCVHGTCQQPYQCLCKVIMFKYLPHLLQQFFLPHCNSFVTVFSLQDGWKGLFCSSPVCAEGCLPSQGTCTRPGECRCR